MNSKLRDAELNGTIHGQTVSTPSPAESEHSALSLGLAVVARLSRPQLEFGFTFKPGETVSILGKLFGQRLDGNFTPQFRISRTPDFSHPSLAKGGQDLLMGEFGAGFHWMNKTTGWLSGQ